MNGSTGIRDTVPMHRAAFMVLLLATGACSRSVPVLIHVSAGESRDREKGFSHTAGVDQADHHPVDPLGHQHPYRHRVHLLGTRGPAGIAQSVVGANAPRVQPEAAATARSRRTRSSRL